MIRTTPWRSRALMYDAMPDETALLLLLRIQHTYLQVVALSRQP